MRILIVEDEEKLAAVLKKGLEKQGYAVDWVADGEAAQKRIELYSKDYDLVVLDLMLPKRDGVEVCKGVRSQGITTPILVLTARDEINDKVIALDGGADDYLVKPFSFDELLARIRALLRRPEQTLQTNLQVGDIELSANTRKVNCRGREVPLTLKEFQLLEYFMRHPNQVLKREQIIDHIWDFAFDAFSNVLDVHVKNLRKKMGYGNGNEFLETVRGVGYRFKG